MRAVAAENAVLKQQLLVIHRSRRRPPNLSPLDRFLFAFWSLFLGERRIPRVAIILRPSMLLSFHGALKKGKHRLLYTPDSGRFGSSDSLKTQANRPVRPRRVGLVGPALFTLMSSSGPKERVLLTNAAR
jgi:hypothetical protein